MIRIAKQSGIVNDDIDILPYLWLVGGYTNGNDSDL